MTTPTVDTVLHALDTLDDTTLRAIISRTQTLLLDRPVGADNGDDSAVEIVDGAESRLLSALRALGPALADQLWTMLSQLMQNGELSSEPPSAVVMFTENAIRHCEIPAARP